MATSPLIDTDMVDEVTKLGFDRDEVIQSIKHRQQNKVRRVIVPTSSQQQGSVRLLLVLGQPAIALCIPGLNVCFLAILTQGNQGQRLSG